MNSLRRLLPYWRAYRGVLIAGTLWLALTDGLALLIPWALKQGIDAMGAGRFAAVGWAAALLGGAALLRSGTRILSRLRFLQTARLIEIDLRRDLLSALLQRDAAFFDRQRTGDLLSRFTSDLANVRMFAGFGLLTLLNTALIYVLTLSVLFYLSPGLTLIALGPYLLMLLLVKWLSRHLLHHSTRVQEGAGMVSQAVEEGVSGQAVIRAGNLAALRAAHFEGLNADYLQRNLALARLRSLMLPIMSLVGPVGTMLVIAFGGGRVAAGALSLGELVAFQAYLLQLAWPTLLLGWVLTLVQRAAASMTRLDEVLNQPAAAPAGPGRQPPAGAPALELRQLNFSYGERLVLRDLTLQLPAGALIGLTGPTGSGKSTLLKLLSGLYPLPPQSILLDGVDLTELDGAAHRRRLAVVPQEGRLFSGSLEQNLLYAVPEGGTELLKRTAGAVQLDQEVAEFAEGYATRVGEGGLTLSGGQRQRVCLGRALARGGRLWLLDDPFSHLDAATAREVWGAMRPLLSGETVLLASGRVSLLEGCDQILVLEAGALAEAGSHAELLARGGRYASMAEQEALERELERLP
jgi:ATP-binding cassette subfamily B protein